MKSDYPSLFRPAVRLAVRLAVLLAAASSFSCETSRHASSGLSPEERAAYERSRPLSSDKDSTFSRMTMVDGAVALRVAEF